MASWASCLPTAIFAARVPNRSCELFKNQTLLSTLCHSMSMIDARASTFSCTNCHGSPIRCGEITCHAGFAPRSWYIQWPPGRQSRFFHKRRVLSDRAEESLSSQSDVLWEDTEVANDKVDYNWEEEWYPVYLTRELSRDSPLGITVFDKPLVLHYDGDGIIRCYDDCCPHRLAKLSEGQIINGKLECLYHGWQFEGDGKCAKIPQLPIGAKIPKAACVRAYAVQESQGVIWVWMGDRSLANVKKIPYFEHYDDPNMREFSSMNVLPYDHFILLENIMDPAHIPISHDRTDFSAKRENAQALDFEIIERTSRGFAGRWREKSSGSLSRLSRFEAPCTFRNETMLVDQDGNKSTSSAVMLCTPLGQGKSMLIARFGRISEKPSTFLIPTWLVHRMSCKILEQDMGLLASQNETLLRKGVPTSNAYLNLRSSDTFVIEYRKWLDRVGHGMPYYVGHKSLASPPKSPVLSSAPAGLTAATAASQPTKGALGVLFSADLSNRYFRHVVHCADCRRALGTFKRLKIISYILAGISAALGILAARTTLKIALVLISAVGMAASYFCQLFVNLITTNELRPHRR